MNDLLNRLNIFLIILYLLAIVPLWGSHLSGKQPWPVFKFVADEQSKTLAKSKIIKLNLLIPPGFADLYKVPAATDRRLLDLPRYITYYKEAATVLPSPFKADAYAMIGYCYYFMGEFGRSKEYYLKSINENPAFIWTYYNLALILFREGDYRGAVELALQLKRLDPEISLKIILSSKIYTDVLREGKGIDMVREIKSVEEDAGRILVASMYKLTGSGTADDLKDLTVRFF